MQRQTVLKGLLILSVIVLGEAGHVLLDALGAEVAHHVFHIAFPLVAFSLFAVFVARDVRAHGWPRFSWRLRGQPVPARPLAQAWRGTSSGRLRGSRSGGTG